MGLSSWYCSGDVDYDFPANEELAYEYARRSAERGSAKAYFAMGYFNEIGVGVPQKNLEEAKRWYSSGADKNDKHCIERLEQLTAQTQLSKRFHEETIAEKRRVQRSMTLQRRKNNKRQSDFVPPPPVPVPDTRGRARQSSAPVGPRPHYAHKPSFSAVVSPPPDLPSRNFEYPSLSSPVGIRNENGFSTLDPATQQNRRASTSPLRNEYTSPQQYRSVSAVPLGRSEVPAAGSFLGSAYSEFLVSEPSSATNFSPHLVSRSRTPSISPSRPLSRSNAVRPTSTPPPFENFPPASDQNQQQRYRVISPRPYSSSPPSSLALDQVPPRRLSPCTSRPSLSSVYSESQRQSDPSSRTTTMTSVSAGGNTDVGGTSSSSVDQMFAVPKKKKKIAPQTFEEMGIPRPSKESDCVVM